MKNYLGKVVSLLVPVVSLILELSVPIVELSLPPLVVEESVLRAELSVWFIMDESPEVPVDDWDVSHEVKPMLVASKAKKKILFINYFLMFWLLFNYYQHMINQVSCQLIFCSAKLL